MEQVKSTPEAIAIVFEGEALSYKELDEKSNRFANYLKEDCKIEAEDSIGILMDRSTWSLISILGILKAGACIYL